MGLRTQIHCRTWASDVVMETETAPGAYGFAIAGAGDAAHLLNTVPATWPRLTLGQLIDDTVSEEAQIGEDSARIPLLPEGTLLLERTTGAVTYQLSSPIGVEALVHPYLAPAAAVHAGWLGWDSYHAAGVVIDGAVWGIAGDRGVGKSTLVAALSARGLEVMADDLCVIQGDRALAGPRTIDLREQSADRFGATRELGVTGMRERWRLDVGPAPLSAPFAGWIYPEWADEVTVASVPLPDRLRRPQENRAATVTPPEPEHALWIAGLPAYAFARPRSWDAMETSMDALLEALG